MPFEKVNFHIGNYGVDDVQYYKPLNPIRDQDKIMDFFPLKGYEKLKGGLDKYNNGNHIIMWYDLNNGFDQSTYDQAIAMMQLFKEMIDDHFEINMDLFVINVTNFNSENKFRASKETYFFQDKNKKEFPLAFTTYSDGYLIDICRFPGVYVHVLRRTAKALFNNDFRKRFKKYQK